MHVISCRVRDEVCIGEDVRIVVLEVTEERIRLGITSPYQFPEYQEEVIYLMGGPDQGTDWSADADHRLVGI